MKKIYLVLSPASSESPEGAEQAQSDEERRGFGNRWLYLLQTSDREVVEGKDVTLAGGREERKAVDGFPSGGCDEAVEQHGSVRTAVAPNGVGDVQQNV